MQTNKIYSEILDERSEQIEFRKEYSLFIKRVYVLFVLLIISVYLSDYLNFCRNGDYNIFHYFSGRNFSSPDFKRQLGSFLFLTFFPLLIFFLLTYQIFSKIFKITINSESLIIDKAFGIKKVIKKSDKEIFSIEFLSNEIVLKNKFKKENEEYTFSNHEMFLKLQDAFKKFGFGM